MLLLLAPVVVELRRFNGFLIIRLPKKKEKNTERVLRKTDGPYPTVYRFAFGNHGGAVGGTILREWNYVYGTARFRRHKLTGRGRRVFVLGVPPNPSIRKSKTVVDETRASNDNNNSHGLQ